MYRVDGHDEVFELHDVPQSSVGAPLPIVLASEHLVLLAYLTENRPPNWDGTTVRVVDHSTPREPAALIELLRPPPTSSAHQTMKPSLATRSPRGGLHPYGAFEVRPSSWVLALERMNRVHPDHNPAHIERLRHFVFAFHDSTFDCAEEGYRISTHDGLLSALLPAMGRRLIDGMAAG